MQDTFKRESLEAAKECTGEYLRSRARFVSRETIIEEAGEYRGESLCQAYWEP